MLLTVASRSMRVGKPQIDRVVDLDVLGGHHHIIGVLEVEAGVIGRVQLQQESLGHVHLREVRLAPLRRLSGRGTLGTS